MNDKKKYVVISIFFMIGLLLGISISKNNDKVLENTYEEKNTIRKNENTLSMMIETKVLSGDYEMTTRDSWPTEGYIFNSTLSKCENGGELSWDDENKKILMSGNVSDKCYIYFDIIPTIADVCSNGDILTNCIKNFGNKGHKISNIYIHNSSLTMGAEDNSYRYAGSSEVVDNFVCFGSTSSPCPTDNLYRIIGVINDKVKLIKYDYANTNLLGTNGDYKSSTTPDTNYKGGKTSIDLFARAYYDDGDWINNWSEVSLNTINLNQNYLSNIGTEWSSKISSNIWNLGSGNIDYGITLYIKSVYKDELNGDSYGPSKIGIISASDYGYARLPSDWQCYDCSQYASSNNWIYMGVDESILNNSANNGPGYVIKIDGFFYRKVEPSAVRPVFYLETSITYVSGSGIQSDPIIIS